jgi:DDE superfamily endonuclease/Helix-turn-helix of DDE superfamily endonuclease
MFCFFQMQMYTGLSPKAVLSLINTLSTLKLNYYCGWQVTSVALEDQVLMTLMKLRLNTPLLDLSVRFHISERTVTNIFKTILFALHKLLFVICMNKVPSRRKCSGALPPCFSNFKNCTQIWDCTEVCIQVPRENLDAQRMTYSSYKSTHTFKALISIAPNGTVVYCSNLYTGNTSDKEIVRSSGILQTCSPGDLILADKGFLVRDILPPGVSLNLPPFLNSSSRQFSENQVLQTRSIARARIHVERVIQRAKEYNILDCIPHHYRSASTVILQTCFALVNLQRPVLSCTSSTSSSSATTQDAAAT